MDVSGAMALLNFIEQSGKSGLSVTLEQVPAHIEKILVTMASSEQKDKLLFTEADVMQGNALV
ncbi:sulfate transporter, partial [Bacillus cereus]